MNIEISLAYDKREEVLQLFSEYTEMLKEVDPLFELYLSLQNYEQEISDLEYKYGLPEGRLYLACCDGALAGCIGLRKLDDIRCEMKRLYVRPEFRGKGIAETLIQRIMDDARSIGYKHMLLDTLPALESAVFIYRRLGFYDIPCYNNSPEEDTIYLQYDL